MTIIVQIHRGKGFLSATSDDLPGLFVLAEDQETLDRNIPECIALIMKHKTGKHYNVAPL